MIHRASHRIRALFALALFVVSSGGAQLADGLLFHGRVERPDVARWNDGDHCHAEACDLGVPIVSAPPIDLAHGDGRLEPPVLRAASLPPADVRVTVLVAGPVGSRAPPLHS